MAGCNPQLNGYLIRLGSQLFFGTNLLEYVVDISSSYVPWDSLWAFRGDALNYLFKLSPFGMNCLPWLAELGCFALSCQDRRGAGT